MYSVTCLVALLVVVAIISIVTFFSSDAGLDSPATASVSYVVTILAETVHSHVLVKEKHAHLVGHEP